MSCWFSVAARGLLNLDIDYQRRIWFIIDELPTLNRLRDLETLLTEGRKYGGFTLVALQSPSQLEATYGRDLTKTILGNCSTKIVFAENDPEIAARISKTFGEQEVKECQEGISYGAHEVRDGVSLSMQSRMRPTVSATDIQSLNKNKAFLKLPGNLPIAKIQLDIVV